MLVYQTTFLHTFSSSMSKSICILIWHSLRNCPNLTMYLWNLKLTYIVVVNAHIYEQNTTFDLELTSYVCRYSAKISKIEALAEMFSSLPVLCPILFAKLSIKFSIYLIDALFFLFISNQRNRFIQFNPPVYIYLWKHIY